MPEPEIKKLYYSISEVSRITGLDQHVLRFWETEFPELKPKKNRAGRRIYMEADLRLVQRIQRLLKEDKYTIEGAKQALYRKDPEAAQAERLREELRALRSFLQQVLEKL